MFVRAIGAIWYPIAKVILGYASGHITLELSLSTLWKKIIDLGNEALKNNTLRSTIYIVNGMLACVLEVKQC